jgi:hypothetical protein
MAPLTGHKKGVHFLGEPVMVPLTAPLLMAFFWGEHISSKMGPFAPFLATMQPLSKARVFLLGENKRKLLCMGHTFTANKSLPLNNSPKQLSVSWESNPARVKASKNFNIYSNIQNTYTI